MVGGYQLENDAKFETGTQELQTVDYCDFLDPFLPSGHKRSTTRYQSTSNKVLTAGLKISYRLRTHPLDASIIIIIYSNNNK